MTDAIKKPRQEMTFAQRYKVAEAIKDMIEPDGDSHIKYKDRLTEAAAAAVISKKLGFEILPHALKYIRQEAFGQMRKGPNGGPGAGGFGKLAALREDVSALAAKVEKLEKVVAHFDAAQSKRRIEAVTALRQLTGTLRQDRSILDKQMRGQGFSDEDIAMALQLSGAIIRQNGAGSTVEVPRK